MTSIADELDKILASMPSLELNLNEQLPSRTPTKSSFDLAERERTRLTDNGPVPPLRRHTLRDVETGDNDEYGSDYMKRHTVADNVPRTPRTPVTAIPLLPNDNPADALKNAEKENERLKRELETMQLKRFSSAQQERERSVSRSSTSSITRGLDRSMSERSSSRPVTPSRGLERTATIISRDSSVASDRHSRPSTPSRALDGLEKERERLHRDSDGQRNAVPDRHSRPSTPSALSMQIDPVDMRINQKEGDDHRAATASALERGASTSSRGLERDSQKRPGRDGTPKVEVMNVTPSADGGDEERLDKKYRPITVLESGERERAGLKREIDALKRENQAAQLALDAAHHGEERMLRELEGLRAEAEKLRKENEKYVKDIERRDRRMSMEGRTADALAVAEHENDQLRDELDALRATHERCEIELEEVVLVAQRAQQEAASIPRAPAFVSPDMMMTAGLHQVKALNEGIRRLSHSIAAGLEWDRDAYAGYNARGNYTWRDRALVELTPFLSETAIRYIKSQVGAGLPLASMQYFVQILLTTFCDWKVSTWLSEDATLGDLFSQHKQGTGNRLVEPNDVPVYNVLRWRAYIHEHFSNLLADDTAAAGSTIHRRQEFDGILNRLRTTGPWRFKVDRTIISSLFAGLLQNLDDLKQTLEAGTASLSSYSGAYGTQSGDAQHRQLVLWLVNPGTLVRENLVDVQGTVNANYDEVILGNAGLGFGSLSITSPDRRGSMQSVTSTASRLTKKCRLEFMHNYNCLPSVVVERSLPYLGVE